MKMKPDGGHESSVSLLSTTWQVDHGKAHDYRNHSRTMALRQDARWNLPRWAFGQGIMALRQDARWNPPRWAFGQGIMASRQDARWILPWWAGWPGNHGPTARCAMESSSVGIWPGNHGPTARCAMESSLLGICQEDLAHGIQARLERPPRVNSQTTVT
jgi:hypothetical protein